MKQTKWKEILVPAAALFVICLCVTALLAVTNQITAEPIAEQNRKTAETSRLTVCPQAKEFVQVEINQETAECYKALDAQGTVIGYAISSWAKGYGGDVKVMTGISAEDDSIIAVNVYDNSNETPGLGINTSNDSFTSQFQGGMPAKGYNTGSPGDDEIKIDAVTGATISSDAVVTAVNQALTIYKTVKEGGGNG